MYIHILLCIDSPGKIQAVGGQHQVATTSPPACPKEWSGMREAEEAKEVSKQPTIKETLERGTKVDPKSDLQKKFDRLLLELIGTNFLAFSFIDSPEFHNFVNFLNKNFNIKTAQTYRRGMSNYAKDILSKVIQQLTDFCDVGMAATTDIWSSRTQDSYISLTSHFVDKHFRLHR